MVKKLTLFLIVIITSLAFFTLVTRDAKVIANKTETYTPRLDNLKGNHFTGLFKEIQLNDQNYLVVGTDKGVYFTQNLEVDFGIPSFTESKVVKAVYTVGDTNENGFDDYLMIRNKEVVLYDSKDNSTLWTFIPQMNAYESNLGYYKERVRIEDYIINDQTLVLAAGYKLFIIDLSTGKSSFEYKADDNIWDVIKVKGSGRKTNYLIAVQGGDVVSISESRTVNWSKTISEPVYVTDERDNLRTYDTSIMRFAYEANSNSVYSVSENGKVYTIDLTSGSILNTYDDYKLSNNFIKSHGNWLGKGRKYPMFRFRDIELVDDYDGDGKADLLYKFNMMTHQFDHIEAPSLKLLGTKGNTDGMFSEKWSRETSVSDHRLSKNLIYNNERVLFNYISSEQTGANGVRDYYGFWSFKEGLFHDERIDFTDFHRFIETNMQNSMIKMINLTNGSFAFLINEDLIILEFNEDGTFDIQNKQTIVMNTELTIESDYTLKVDSSNWNRIDSYTRFSVVNNVDSEPLWVYETMDKKAMKYEYMIDINQDGFKEVVLLYNKEMITNPKTDKNIGTSFTYEVLDGKTGDVMIDRQEIIIPAEKTIVQETDQEYENLVHSYLESYIRTFKISHDVTSDGMDDLVVTLSNGDFLFYDLTKEGNQLVDFYTSDYELLIQTEDLQLDPLTIEHPHYIHDGVISSSNLLLRGGDSNGDGCIEYLVHDGSGLKSVATYKDQNLCKIKPNLQLLNLENQINVSSYFNSSYIDINGDGKDELIINDIVTSDYKMNTLLKEGLSIYIIDSETGQLLYQDIKSIKNDVRRNDYNTMYFIDDVNNDQYRELVSVIRDDSQGKITITVTDIKTDSILLEKQMNIIHSYTDTPFRPIISIPDTNQNGKPEIVIAQKNYYINTQGHNKFEFYELGLTNKLELINHETFIMPADEEPNFDTYQGFSPEHFVNYVEYNNEQYLYGVYKGRDTYFYNLTHSKLEMVLKDQLLLDLIQDRDLPIFKTTTFDSVSINFENPLRIKGLKNESTINKQVELEFLNKVDGEVYIYINDQIVGKTTNNSYTLDLLEGDYTIKVSQRDNMGKEYFYSIDVTVTKNYTYLIILPLVTVCLLAALIVLPRKRTTYKNPLLKFEGSDLSE
ncbi:PQQ-binding-like beta-propeller repeat protein [Haloplasma contractile]|uniref:Uncharacterized protein n=1 Tax=Haloplasma contractile SSD-17B TaxID=1033810 RepID=U2EE44_9MOLU|nr:hypothetical protein [Haloplasma contractile]ERJ12981.1 hypothetical protein HLPCO_000580 [Haloplasma contractile SSD-17B]